VSECLSRMKLVRREVKRHKCYLNISAHSYAIHVNKKRLAILMAIGLVLDLRSRIAYAYHMRT
jgi:hypothetical protein